MADLDSKAARERQSIEAGKAPPAWDNLLGMEEVLHAWRPLVKADRLPAVLLLCGKAGIGKRPLLAALAAMHVCETGYACGTCRQCLWLRSGLHPEVLWVEGEDGKLLSESASEVQDHLSLSAAGGVKARIAVIVDCDQLTLQAANRLLKTLEEPPPRCRILLSTSRQEALPATILSRCVRWRVTPPAVDASRAWLKDKLREKGVERSETEVDRSLKQAGLAPGRALELALEGDAERLPDLFGSPSIGQGLRAAENWARESGVGVADLLALAEMQLNEYYAGTASAPPQAAELRRRRTVLTEAKALARGGKVPLNSQLVLESLATAGVSKTR